MRTGCQYVGYLYDRENLNWIVQNLQLGYLQHVGRMYS